MNKLARKRVGLWLIIGLVMVFFQVVIGGITRLTDSGLSITEWEVIKGVLPPTNDAQWQIAFEKYQNQAKQQYENLHRNMNLSQFKVIYFWEWFHRLWARSMGFVFILPLFYFLYKKYLPGWLIKHLAIVVFLAALVASLGWIMVVSGLENENRTWVSAYKLAMHLGVAALLFGYLFFTWLKVAQPKPKDLRLKNYKRYSGVLVAFIFIQILLGALMAGMRAGTIHPHWPFFMGNNTLAIILQQSPHLSFADFVNYESNNIVKAVVQVLHRSVAWGIYVATWVFFIKIYKKRTSIQLKQYSLFALLLVNIQFLLGVVTIIKYNFRAWLIPLGVLHQAFAFLTLIACLAVYYQFQKKQY